MNKTSSALILGTLVLAAFGAAAMADVQTGTRPKDATALCKDGTFSTSSDQSTACTRNGGLQEWWGGKVLPPKDVPATSSPSGADPRGPYDKAEHPQPVTPPAGAPQH